MYAICIPARFSSSAPLCSGLAGTLCHTVVRRHNALIVPDRDALRGGRRALEAEEKRAREERLRRAEELRTKRKQEEARKKVCYQGNGVWRSS